LRSQSDRQSTDGHEWSRTPAKNTWKVSSDAEGIRVVTIIFEKMDAGEGIIAKMIKHSLLLCAGRGVPAPSNA
jgi:hypothetical protein